jgi:hypothetical protein
LIYIITLVTQEFSQMSGVLRNLMMRHQNLKERIHAYRLPLSPRGQLIMKCVYASIPLVGGYAVMQWAARKSEVNLAHLKKSDNPGVREQNARLQQVLRRAEGGAKDQP